VFEKCIFEGKFAFSFVVVPPVSSPFGPDRTSYASTTFTTLACPCRFFDPFFVLRSPILVEKRPLLVWAAHNASHIRVCFTPPRIIDGRPFYTLLDCNVNCFPPVNYDNDLSSLFRCDSPPPPLRPPLPIPPPFVQPPF